MGAIADHSSREIESNQRGAPMENITIRTATAADQAAIRRLAVLDSAFPPTGEVLLAEAGDELWAALSVDTGHAVADPFRRSADLVELLSLRAARVRGEAPSQPRALA